MRYEITIDRFSGDSKVSNKNWSKLISALVLVGYEVYGNDEKIIFKLGYDDILKRIIDEN